MSNINDTQPIHPLRQRMIEDMTLRGLSAPSQKAYIRAVRRCSEHLGVRVAFQNKKPVYDALFKAVSETLRKRCLTTTMRVD